MLLGPSPLTPLGQWIGISVMLRHGSWRCPTLPPEPAGGASEGAAQEGARQAGAVAIPGMPGLWSCCLPAPVRCLWMPFAGSGCGFQNAEDGRATSPSPFWAAAAAAAAATTS